VSTISQPGCSTSVVLLTGPTEEEEEEDLETLGSSTSHNFISEDTLLILHDASVPNADSTVTQRKISTRKQCYIILMI